MNGYVVRVVLLGIMAIASAFGVWAVHASVGKAIGPIGAVLAAIVAALMLGTLLWVAGALARPATPRDRGAGGVPDRAEPGAR